MNRALVTPDLESSWDVEAVSPILQLVSNITLTSHHITTLQARKLMVQISQ